MPYGAYKINAWGGNLNDAPVIPNGLTINSGSVDLNALTISNAANHNYNNQIAHLGGSGTNLYFVVGYGSQTASNSYTALVSYQINLGTTVQSSTASNSTQGNNEVACNVSHSNGPGNDIGLVVSSWNIGSGGTGLTTDVKNNSLYITNFNLNTGGTTFAGGNTTGVILPCNYNKGKASVMTYAQSSSSSSVETWFGVSHLSGTNYIRTYAYSATASFTALLNQSNSNTYNIDNGVRVCSFKSTNAGSNEANIIYIGYKTSPADLYVGSFFTSGTLTLNQSFTSLGLNYTTKNAMISTIWDDAENNIRIAVIQHSDQYLRFVKTTAFGSTFSSVATQSQDFLISSSPNTWYRLCGTGINGLGALVYYNNTDNYFYIRFFTINSAMTTITWGNAQQLGINTTNNMILMNADVKYTNMGFGVGIFASDGVLTNRVYTHQLWPSVSRPFTNAQYQNTFALANVNAGNSRLISSVKKFGSTSLISNTSGLGSYWYSSPGSLPYYGIGTGAFTIEFWVNITVLGTTSSANNLWSLGQNFYGISYKGTDFWHVDWVTADKLIVGSALTLNTWYHVALVRNGSTINFYVNGTSLGSFSDSTNFSTLTGQQQLQGLVSGNTVYMDEFRFSNVARYTANFTPPIAAFSNDPNTVCLLHFNGENNTQKIYDDYGPQYLA